MSARCHRREELGFRPSALSRCYATVKSLRSGASFDHYRRILSGLGLALRVLGLEGRKAWMENPGFPFTRRGLELARLSLASVPVDADGIDVDYGLHHAPDGALVVVNPGQQAPLGSTLSLARRLRLLDWAAQEGVWVIEEDYLSELQLKGRATPALASLDRTGRVIHIGSFSKTISPTLRLGFLVAPLPLASRLPRWRCVSRRRQDHQFSSRSRCSCAKATSTGISDALSASTQLNATR